VIDVNLPPDYLRCKILNINKTFSLIATKISFIRCQFDSNKHTLLEITNDHEVATLANVSFESLNISHNTLGISRSKIYDLILVSKMNVYINGLINVVDNNVHYSSIVWFKSCDVLFSSKIKFNKNNCNQVILLDTHIKVMEYAIIIFVNNIYTNNLVAVAQQYNQPYLFCLFQYIAMNSSTLSKKLLIHYDIIFKYNWMVKNYLHKTVIAVYSISLSFYLSL